MTVYAPDTYRTAPGSRAQLARVRLLWAAEGTYGGLSFDEIEAAFDAEDRERRAAAAFIHMVRGLCREQPGGHR